MPLHPGGWQFIRASHHHLSHQLFGHNDGSSVPLPAANTLAGSLSLGLHFFTERIKRSLRSLRCRRSQTGRAAFEKLLEDLDKSSDIAGIPSHKYQPCQGHDDMHSLLLPTLKPDSTFANQAHSCRDKGLDRERKGISSYLSI